MQTCVVHLIYCLKLSYAARASFICQLTTCHRNSNLEQGYSALFWNANPPDLARSPADYCWKKFMAPGIFIVGPACYQQKKFTAYIERKAWPNNHFVFLSEITVQNGYCGSLWPLIV